MYENLFAMENELLGSTTRKDRTKLDLLLSPDFFEFGSSGTIWTRQEVLERLPTEVTSQVEASDFQAYPLAEGTALVTYKTQCIEPDGSISKALRSSVWKLEGTRWRLRFHQGTKIS